MRLIHGPDEFRGTVQVYYDGHFGTICDDRWDDVDAQVVCSQLGYSGGIARGRFNSYGLGFGRVILDEVACYGNARNILQCDNSGKFSGITCLHLEDAGVDCGK